MPVPGFQSFLLPVLEVASDGQEHSVAEAVETVAVRLGLTAEDRREVLPSGSQRRVDNRVNWACSYLRQAQLLESTGRGRFKITPRGQQVLSKGIARIDVRFLDQFEEFAEFRSRSRSRGQENGEQQATDQAQTPEEVLESSFLHLRRQLAHDLLDRIKKSSPAFFERLVVDLLVAMGYGGSRQDAGQAVGQSGDGGIDGIIKEDRLGLDAVYIQAKRWEGTVGRPVVQAFAGSLEGQRARKGVLITTSAFSQDARDYVTRIEKKIVLIDGDLLTELMIDHGVGVAEVASYSVRKVDQDYFEDEN